MMIGHQTRRRVSVTRDQISLPTEFAHVDGVSFLDQKVIELDDACYRVFVQRLKTPAAALSCLVTRRQCAESQQATPQPLTSCRARWAFLRRGASNRNYSSSSSRGGGGGGGGGGGLRATPAPLTAADIGEPFKFVHVKHVSLESLQQRPLPDIVDESIADVDPTVPIQPAPRCVNCGETTDARGDLGQLANDLVNRPG